MAEPGAWRYLRNHPESERIVAMFVWETVVWLQIFVGIALVMVVIYRVATVLGFTAKSEEIEPWSIREIRFLLLFLTALALAVLTGVRVARENGLSAILPP